MSSNKLSELDPDSPEYWEQVLRDHHLGIHRGRNSNKLHYAGSTKDLEIVESMLTKDLSCGVGGGRRVSPRGSKPE